MEKIFEMPFMIKLQEFGQNLGNNKFLGALQAAMMSLMGVIMIGAISQVICAVGSSLLNLFPAGGSVYNLVYLPYQYTMNLLSVWVVATLAFHYAKNLEMKSPIMNALNALICFFLVAGTLTATETGAVTISMTYLGAQGMFTGFLVVFITVRIDKFCTDKNVRIKMPSAVPQFLQDGFASIIPLLFSIVLFIVISTVISISTNGAYTVCSGFMALLSAPLGTLTSVPGIIILATFAVLLWCFGIHGSMVLMPVIIPLLLTASTTNAQLHEAGQPLQFFPILLYGTMSSVGGTGNTLPLALFGLRSKSKQISAVAKVSLVPSWFGINEPMTFGFPIMYNPILCIPYVLNVPILMILSYIAYQVGFLQPAWISVTALLPMGFAGYLGTLRWQNAIWSYILLIPACIIYYPFFKVYEKQLIAKEKEAEEAEQAA